MLLPTTAFASEPINTHWKSEVIRIPVTLTPAGGQTSAPADVISGYIDFWVETDTLPRIAYANWVVTMDSPNTYITAVNLAVYYSGNEFNGGDKWEPFNYPTGGPRISASGQGSNFYKLAGSYSATLSGSVMTNKGSAFIVSPNKTVYFSFVL